MMQETTITATTITNIDLRWLEAYVLYNTTAAALLFFQIQIFTLL